MKLCKHSSPLLAALPTTVSCCLQARGGTKWWSMHLMATGQAIIPVVMLTTIQDITNLYRPFTIQDITNEFMVCYFMGQTN